MSDNMEREKNERLTSREIEEEEAEMRRELSGMGMYEPGYTYKDMKAILGFISESKDMAKMGAESKNAQKESVHSSNSYKSEDVAKITSPQDSESKDHIELPKANYTYRTGRASPTAYDRISTCGSSSPELMYDLKSSVNRHKCTDRDDVYERLHDNSKTRDNNRCTNKYMALSPHNVSQDSQTMSSMDAKVDAQLEHSQLLDRWRIDPFDVPASENDVPLQGPARRPVQERVPFRQCREAKTPEKREKTILELSAHMKEMADLWHSWHRTADPKFQWGSPIQVGAANGSLEKNPLKETSAEHGSGDLADNDSQGRMCKRKAHVAITTAKTRSESTDDGDSDEKEYFVHAKRRRSLARLIKTTRSSALDTEQPSSSGTTVDESSPVDVDDAKLEEVTATRKKSKPTENNLASPSCTYPRRIIPPNPAAKANKSRKLRSFTLKATESHAKVKSNPAKPQSMEQESDGPGKSENANEDTSRAESTKVELKPIPMKNLSLRLQKQCTMLKEVEASRMRNPKAKKEEAEKKAMEEKKRKEEFHKRQLLELANERKKQFESRRVEIEKGARYKELLLLKQKECRVRLERCREAEEKKRMEKEEEDRLLADTDDEAPANFNMPGCSSGQTSCPICFLNFPNDKIEMHAAECRPYEVNTRSERRNSTQSRQNSAKNSADSRRIVLECSICSTYKTSDCTEYEEHVNGCLQRKQRERNRSPETTINVVGNLPTSPISCFRPISEQTDSDINYRSQFATSSKTYNNRKRKR